MGAGEIVVWRVGEATVPNAMDGAGVKANRFVELDPDPRGAVPLVTVDMVQPDKPEGKKGPKKNGRSNTRHAQGMFVSWDGCGKGRREGRTVAKRVREGWTGKRGIERAGAADRIRMCFMEHASGLSWASRRRDQITKIKHRG